MLSHYNDDIISAQIGQLLSQIYSGKLSHEEAMQAVAKIENLYIRKYGAKKDWDSALTTSFKGILQAVERSDAEHSAKEAFDLMEL